MTEVLAEDLREVVETVWSVTLGLELPEPLSEAPPLSELGWCGCVHVTGAWSGVVKVSMGEALTRRAAAAMFGAAGESLSVDELSDALGEIANMTGGNVKALLPGPSRLSLPSVISGGAFSVSSPGGTLLRELAFQAQGLPLRVQVVEGRPREEAPSTEAP